MSDEQQNRKKQSGDSSFSSGPKNKIKKKKPYIIMLDGTNFGSDDKVEIDPMNFSKGGRAGYKGGKSVKKKSSRKAVRGGGCEIR